MIVIMCLALKQSGFFFLFPHEFSHFTSWRLEQANADIQSFYLSFSAFIIQVVPRMLQVTVNCGLLLTTVFALCLVNILHKCLLGLLGLSSLQGSVRHDVHIWEQQVISVVQSFSCT